MLARYLLTAATLLAVTLVATPDAEARRGWRQSRWNTNRTYRSNRGNNAAYQAWQQARRPSTGPITYSGISRAEQDYWRRQEAWYDYAWGGWRPGDFR